MSLRKITASAVVSSIIMLFQFQGARAGYSLTPLVTTLDFSQNITSAEVEIKSEQGDAKIPMAIELKVQGRDVGVDGETVTYRDDKSAEKFVVYPSQIVLMPGENQRVQIKWVGDSIPKKETAYGLIAEQAPVKLGDEEAVRTKAQGRVQVLVRYEGAIDVIPPSAKPRTVVSSAVAGQDKDGKNRIVLVIHNDGTGRQKLAGMKLTVTPLDKDGKMIFKKNLVYNPVLSSRQTKQSLFPGYSRQLDLDWPDKLPVGPVRAVVEFVQGN
jgi:fimbrial chaperone protein